MTKTTGAGGVSTSEGAGAASVPGGGGGGGAAVIVGHPQDPAGEFAAALAAARMAEPVFDGRYGEKYFMLPPGFGMQVYEDQFALPPRVLQSVTVDDRASFAAYVNRFSDARSVLIADLDTFTITGVLDYHGAATAEDPAAPSALRHKVALVFRPSEEFKRWNGIQDKYHSQAAFAEFLDENSVDIVDPEPAIMIEIARDLEATKGSTFKSSTRLESGDRSFSYTTETQVRGDMRVPSKFSLSIPLFEGEAPRELTARFRFKIGDDGLYLGFVWHRVEHVRRAEFRQTAFELAEMTGRPVFFGRV